MPSRFTWRFRNHDELTKSGLSLFAGGIQFSLLRSHSHLSERVYLHLFSLSLSRPNSSFRVTGNNIVRRRGKEPLGLGMNLHSFKSISTPYPSSSWCDWQFVFFFFRFKVPKRGRSAFAPKMTPATRKHRHVSLLANPPKCPVTSATSQKSSVWFTAPIPTRWVYLFRMNHRCHEDRNSGARNLRRLENVSD